MNETIKATVANAGLAGVRGYTMSPPSRGPPTTDQLMIRRYWYNTANGLENGPPSQKYRRLTQSPTCSV